MVESPEVDRPLSHEWLQCDLARRALSSLAEAEARIASAEVERLPTAQLLDRLQNLWDDEFAETVVYAIKKAQLNSHDEVQLAEILHSLSTGLDRLPTARKRAADRLFARALVKMPVTVNTV